MTTDRDLLTVWTASALSESSSSSISQALRRYAGDLLRAELRHEPLFTDLRERKTAIEAEAGRVFQGWA
ncbi:hypothetical protein [Desulfocurvus vexinensis]|uniref:hypothetical protein n=1 Tax=Desulfocurvus vexinensis TaxID=399548 RepID=UPI00048D2C7C|nr:hypothetical protein [Desulfocurvus vexinensis]